MHRFLAVLGLALLALAQPVSAQTFPKLTGRVVDDAHLLTPAQIVDLTSKSEALEAQSGRQLVIATLPSLQGHTIEDYGYQLGRSWGIGQKGEDDGVILIVAPNEHKVRIETGYAATAFLTDAMSSVIIRNAILPKFKQDPPDYGGGILAGTDQIITQMSLPADAALANVAKAEKAQRDHRDESPGLLPVLFWMVIIIFVIGSMAKGAGGQRYSARRRTGISPLVVLWGLNELNRGSRGGGSSWGGGSDWGGGGGGGGFGGGGFSGGGGSFGGGGASGSW